MRKSTLTIITINPSITSNFQINVLGQFCCTITQLNLSNWVTTCQHVRPRQEKHKHADEKTKSSYYVRLVKRMPKTVSEHFKLNDDKTNAECKIHHLKQACRGGTTSMNGNGAIFEGHDKHNPALASSLSCHLLHWSSVMW